MKKALIVSTVSRQFYLFENANIQILKSLNYEVHGAANLNDWNERLDFLDITTHHIEISRSPLSYKNIKALFQLIKLMKFYKYELVHCHSPVGGVLARIAAKIVKIPTVIYTAHGFHFYKGSPLINWIIYAPIEKILSRITDVIITINHEDYEYAKKIKKTGAVYVPGVGIDLDRFKVRNRLIEENFPQLSDVTTFTILSVGELNGNKNHETIIRAVAQLNNPKLKYIICGTGEKSEELESLSKNLQVEDQIEFLGYRNDLPEIYKNVDLFVFPSFREGLSLSLMEAMATGLPVVCSNIRGNVDLIVHNKGGYLVNPGDVNGFATAINKIINSPVIQKKFSQFNISRIDQFSKELVKQEMNLVYIGENKYEK